MTKYEGKWDRNTRHGKGFAIFTDGSFYRGRFKRDIIDGQGRYKWAQGHEYEGQFKDGKMEGTGIFRHANGQQPLEGTFLRDLFQMVSTVTFSL